MADDGQTETGPKGPVADFSDKTFGQIDPFGGPTSAFATLFGQAGQAGTPGQVIDLTPDEFLNLRGPVTNAIQALFGGGPQFDPSGEGGGFSLGAGGSFEQTRPASSFVAGLGAREQAFLDQIFRSVGNTPDSIGAARDTLTKTAAGGFTDVAQNPALEAAIKAAQRPIIEAFERTALPRLRAGFTNAGQSIQPESSSPFDEAAAQAQGDLINTLGEISTNLTFGSFEAERARQQEAALGAPGFEAEDLNRVISGLQAQALPRLVEDLGIERGLAEFNRRVNVMLEALGLGGTLSSPAGQFAVTQPTPGAPGQEGSIGGILGGAAAIFSARAFKHGHKPMPPVLKGISRLNVEKWRYKPEVSDDQAEHVGPYAEDFQREFGLGDGKTIHLGDSAGILFKAVQELLTRVMALESGKVEA